MSARVGTIAVLALSLAVGGAAAADGPADLIVVNAKVWTVDAARPEAQAFAVGHGRVLAVAGPVGVGKTYVALAVATHFDAVLVVAPAALRHMWYAALTMAGVRADVVSHEELSRCRRHVSFASRAPHPASLTIVDESHRCRSPQTRRYEDRGTEPGSRVKLPLMPGRPS